MKRMTPRFRELSPVKDLLVLSFVIPAAIVGLLWTPASAKAQTPGFDNSRLLLPLGGGQETPSDFPKVGPSGPVPRMPDGKPDLSGIWGIANVGKPGEPQLTPAAAELFAKLRKERTASDEPSVHCLPHGPLWSGVGAGIEPAKFVQAPNLLVILEQGNVRSYHQIFLDGRGHPKDLDPTWFGDSIGKWDGDTLVVDTIGYNDRVWMDSPGHPHTEQLHIVERYHRRDLGNLDIQVTVEDPGTLTKPWIISRGATLGSTELLEDICGEDGNQDLLHLEAAEKLERK